MPTLSKVVVVLLMLCINLATGVAIQIYSSDNMSSSSLYSVQLAGALLATAFGFWFYVD